MSSRINKIKENVANDRKLKEYTLYGSLVGSILVSVGKLVGKTEDELIEEFAKYSKDEEFYKCGNIREAVDYIVKDFKLPEEYKKYIVLCTDENNRFTPIVTLIDDEGYVQPLDRNGTYLGILSQDNFEMEYIYDEDQDCIEG